MTKVKLGGLFDVLVLGPGFPFCTDLLVSRFSLPDLT